MSYDLKLENWMKQWKSAQEKGLFKDAPKPPVINEQTKSSDYFGNIKEQAEPKAVGVKNCDAQYWQQVYKLSKGQKLTEQTSKIEDDPLGSTPQGKLRDVPDKNSLGTKAAELGNAANPVIPSTRGEDQRKHITPDWADGKGLRELVDLKTSLYKLEVKINSHPKFGAYGDESPEIKKIQTQIDELKHKIDELSNSLSPDFVQDELS